MTIPMSFNNGTLTLILQGQAYQTRTTDLNYNAVKKALKSGATEDELVVLFDVPKTISQATSGLVTFNGDTVLCNGELVHNVVADRIIQFSREGLPFEPLMRFLENQMRNPSYKSREECYQFLENKNLPITEDGCFLAYKAVRDDWKDQWSGKISNHVGAKPSMDRAMVDDNQNHHCSKGLHVGAMDYVTSYGGFESRVVIVKVNPEDVVSVPTDSSFMKMRVCRYEVVAEYTGDLHRPLYTDHGDSYDDDFIDDDYGWGDEELDDYFDDGDVVDENAETPKVDEPYKNAPWYQNLPFLKSGR